MEKSYESVFRREAGKTDSKPRIRISFAVTDAMHEYIREASGIYTVSEYIRSLVRREQQHRTDYASRPARPTPTMNDHFVFFEALEQLEKLKAILERKDDYDV